MKRYREFTGGCEVDQSINMAHILMLLSQNGNNAVQYHSVHEEEERVFECKTCNRQFPSFQALGGHRASHKKPKLGSGDFTDSSLGALAKPRLHECSICGLEFSIGQALGGHMRRHRANNEGPHFLGINKNEENNVNHTSTNNNINKSNVVLDLNMPPLMESEIDSKSGGELVTLKLF